MRTSEDRCHNCPDGFDCSTGDYFTGDVELISDLEAAHVEALYEDIYRDWPDQGGTTSNPEARTVLHAFDCTHNPCECSDVLESVASLGDEQASTGSRPQATEDGAQ